MNLPTSVFLSRVDWKTKPHACGAAAFVNAGRIDMDLISAETSCHSISSTKPGGILVLYITICGNATLFYSVTTD